MNKRGDTNIDWVMSIGIFIIYILLLLVWIKPGYKPVFEQDTLISIVKNNIEKDFSWEVRKTLLKLKCNQLGTFDFGLDSYIPVSAGNFDVRRVDTNERAVYGGALTINLYNSNGENDFWVISSDAIYGSNPNELGDPNPIIMCDIIAGEPVIYKGLRDYGGLTLPGFDSSNWGFPQSKEFKIVLSDFQSEICYGKTGHVNCETFQPEGNAVVYSKEWRYNILDKDGNLKPVLITILIW